MNEQKLKNTLFKILLAGKLAVILVVIFHWQSFGFDGKQAAATITLVLPLFSVYTSLMFKEYVASQHTDTEKAPAPRRIKSSRVVTYLFLTVLYCLAIVLIIYVQPGGAYPFESMQAIVAAIETMFGAYIGTIVFSLFKENG
jgi:hypothetical protein